MVSSKFRHSKSDFVFIGNADDSLEEENNGFSVESQMEHKVNEERKVDEEIEIVSDNDKIRMKTIKYFQNIDYKNISFEYLECVSKIEWFLKMQMRWDIYIGPLQGLKEFGEVLTPNGIIEEQSESDCDSNLNADHLDVKQIKAEDKIITYDPFVRGMQSHDSTTHQWNDDMEYGMDEDSLGLESF